MAVRSFCNADLPQLVKLWNDHWGAFGPAPSVGMAQFEQAIVARTFFQAEHLLVSESDSIDGWCLVYCPSSDPAIGWVGCLCLASDAEATVGQQLLQSVETQLSDNGSQTVLFGAARDDRYGMAGLSPIGHGVGVPDHDFPIATLLQNRGYRRQRSFQRLTATVNGYRPPVSRDAMQMRRTTQMDMVPFLHPDERSAAAMSHLDVEMHRLIDRSDSVLARIQLWFSDPEAEVMSPAMAIIDLTTLAADDQLSTAESYLLASAVQSLLARGIAVVETVIDTEHAKLIEQMQGLNFTSADSGSVWMKDLG